ncbi:MAG: type II toxin-antitoxin system VapB family antitoxin [Alphaproteobacteria bacterium]|nr:type II toxin-antitoxin system VapB family antitoxin [Alphaproteobacteria bacterium]
MGTHMKTTIEIADALLDQARATAAQEGTTLRSLVEEGLRAALDRRRVQRPFRLEDASFGGEGLQDEFLAADGADVLRAAYEGRGG